MGVPPNHPRSQDFSIINKVLGYPIDGNPYGPMDQLVVTIASQATAATEATPEAPVHPLEAGWELAKTISICIYDIYIYIYSSIYI